MNLEEDLDLNESDSEVDSGAEDLSDEAGDDEEDASEEEISDEAGDGEDESGEEEGLEGAAGDEDSASDDEEEVSDEEDESGEEEEGLDEAGDGQSEEAEEGASSGDEGEEEESEDEEEEGLSGWADSMSKILKSTKPKNKKNLLLSRARKDYEINQNAPLTKKGNDIEIARDDSKTEGIKEEDGGEKNEEDSNILSLKQQRKLELKQRKLEKAWENLNRMTGEVPDRELETDLVKIATKGVVQLFNAVAQQQKTVKTKLRASRNSEFKKEKVLSKSKEIFDSAMSKSKIVGKGSEDDNSSDDDEIDIKQESSSDEDEVKSKSRKRKSSVISGGGDVSSGKKPVWQALQEDFMLDAKMKDWDKDSGSD